MKRLASLQILLILGAATTAYVVLSEETGSTLILIAVYCLVVAWRAKFELTHPSVWLIPFLYLYHFSVVILNEVGDYRVYYSYEVLIIGWLTILTASLWIAAQAKSGGSHRPALSISAELPIRRGIARWAFWISLSACIIHNAIFFTSGVTAKAEWNQLGLSDYQFVYGGLLLSYAILLVTDIQGRGQVPWRLIGGMIVFTSIVLLNIGERDVLLRTILITGFVLYLKFRPSVPVAVGLGSIAVAIIPLMGKVKNMLVSGRGIELVDDRGFVIGFLRGEFMSAGRNIDTIVSHNDSWTPFLGETFLWDATRSIVPAFVMKIDNSVSWFMKMFHPDILAIGQGYGFSLAAEGYINFGYVGVILVYCVVSWLIAWLYNRSYSGSLGMIVYVLAAPLFVYATRGDMSSILSPLLKQILLPVSVMWFISYFLVRRSRGVSVLGRPSPADGAEGACTIHAPMNQR